MVAGVLVIFSMAILSWKGATAEESLGSANVVLVPEWAEQQGFEDNEAAVAGAEIFAAIGCLNCHTYLGAGTTNLGAPDLSSIGASGQSVQYFADYIANPAEFGNTTMQAYGEEFGGALDDEQLRQLGEFLAASKGPE
jgi:cytochrome c553